MKKSLRRNLFIATIAIVLGCVGPMVTYILESSFIREKKDVEKTVIAISREAANKIKAKVDEETALIHAFAKLPNITRTDYTGEELEAHKDVIEKCAFFIPYYSKQPEKYENVAFYNKEGFLALPNGALIQLKNKPYIIGPCSGKGDYIDDPRPSTAPGTEGQIFMFISTVVTDANDAPIGCMVSVLKGNVLDMVCDTIEVAPGYHPIIVNTKSKEVVTTLNNVSEKDVDAYNKFIMDLTSKKGMYTFQQAGTNEKMVSVSVPVDGTDWAVVSIIPYDYYFGIFWQLRYTIWIQALVSVILLASVLLIIFRKSFRPLMRLDSSITEIASGNADLTQRIETKSKDEVGSVVIGFNKFTEMLQSILKEISASKNKIEKTYKSLTDTVTENKDNLSKILGAMQNVTESSSNQESAVHSTASAVTQISSNIQSLNKMVETQAAAITEASASIEEMIGNINAVTSSIQNMSNEFNSLSTTTKDGIRKNKNVNDLLAKIAEQSQILTDANKTISSVASQTNLLAMNAAIEAAHAGTAGKGFAVVADEIRKLAEESAKQSKNIGTELKSISEQITEVVSEAIESEKLFNMVDAEINTTTQLVEQISNAMSEQEEGSKQVLEALSDMNNSTSEVKSASDEMEKGTASILETVSTLEGTSVEMKKAYSQISEGVSTIKESTNRLNIMNEALGTEVHDIEDKINQFKL